MRYKKYLISEGVFLDAVLRKLKVKTTKGKPSHQQAPEWAKYIGQTPEGAWHWLENNTDVSGSGDKYFPNAGKTEFTGFTSDGKPKGVIIKL